MFAKHLRLKRFLGGIVVTAAVAVVVVPAALSSTRARGGSAQQVQGYRFTTDTLGGARHLVVASQGQPNRFTSDPIAGNDASSTTLVHAYNPNGGQPATVIPDGGTPAPVATGSPTGTGPNWKDIGIGAGFVAALLLLLLAGTPIRNGRRG